MSGRFGPTDPFYVAMAQAESDDRIGRLARADAVRFERQMAARPLRDPVIDHYPGDEDAVR